MACFCNGFSGLIFPDFVQQRCCNPCCRQSSGSVGGTSTTNPTCTCTCTCTQGSGSVRRLRRLRQCGRDLARLQLLPPVRLRLVQQCGRDVQLEPEFRLRLQPVLGLRDKPAQGRKPLRPGRI